MVWAERKAGVGRGGGRGGESPQETTRRHHIRTTATITMTTTTATTTSTHTHTHNIPIRRPTVSLTARLGGAGVHGDLVADHEGRVEAHAELTDNLVFGATGGGRGGSILLLQLLQE